MTDPDGSDESASGGEAPVVRRGRFSIALLMVIVFFMAGDFALLRFVWEEKTRSLTIMVLPTLNLILLGLWRARRAPAAQPFWQGFEVIGSFVVGLIFLLDWGYYRFDWDFFLEPLFWLSRNRWISEDGPANLMISYACFALIYSGPQVLAALIAGWLSARYRIVRRDSPPAQGRDLDSRSRPAPLRADRASGDGVFEAIDR